MNVFFNPSTWQLFICKLLILILIFCPKTSTPTGHTNIFKPSSTLSTTPFYIPQIPQNNSNQKASGLLLAADSLENKHQEEADSLLSQVFQMAMTYQITDSVLLADIYHRQGKYFDRHQKYKDALLSFDKSISIKTNLPEPDSALIAQSYNYRGIAYMRLYYFDSALMCFNQVLELLNDEVQYKRDLYDVNLNIGITHAITGNYDKAYTYFKKAYNILQTSDIVKDSLLVAGFYLNYGLMATSVGKTNEAIEYYAISEKYYKNIRSERYITIAAINTNKGMNAFYNYDFPKAKLYTSNALDIYLENRDFETGVPRTLYNLGSFSISTGNYHEALSYSKQGLSYSPDNDLRLLLTLNLARSYRLLDQPDEANTHYRQALQLLKLENISKTRATKVYELYAEFLFYSNQPDSGYLYLQKSLKESRRLYGSSSNQNAQLITTIGDYFLDNKEQPDSALLYYRKAITLWNNSDSLQLDNYNKTLKSKALAGEARSLAALAKKTGHLPLLLQSEMAFGKVLDQMLSLSLTLSTENKLVLGDMLKPLYQQAIGVEYQLFKQTGDTIYLNKAFKFAESAKSASLLASVNTQYALKTADLPDKVFNFENQIKNEIATLQRILAAEKEKKNPDERKIPYYNNRLLGLMNRYDSLIHQIEIEYPTYYELKYNSGVAGVQEITDHLSKDEVFIEYELTDTILYRILLSPNGTRFDAFSVDSSFFDALTRLISLKNTHIEVENRQRYNQFKQDAYMVYNLLLGNTGLETNDHRITIVPDGLLGYLPFEILIESNPPATTSGDINYSDLPYVVLHHPISYAPSGTLKYNPFFSNKNQNGINNMLAFAPLYQGKVNDDARSNQSRNFGSLPYAKKEAVEVSVLMNGKAITDSLATKESFKRIAGQYGLLHLAMHTIINDTLPMMSKLVFYDEKSDSLSPYLNIYEIYGLSLNAKQVTLSACNTGSGKFKKGEGIMSLARGFLFAGVPSIVMTLWEVQDENGALLMNNYYQFLKDGLPKDVALQQAKISVLKHANMAKSHPFFWSSYVLMGDTTPIVKKQKNHALWIGGLIIIGIILFYSFRKQNHN